MPSSCVSCCFLALHLHMSQERRNSTVRSNSSAWHLAASWRALDSDRANIHSIFATLSRRSSIPFVPRRRVADYSVFTSQSQFDSASTPHLPIQRTVSLTGDSGCSVAKHGGLYSQQITPTRAGASQVEAGLQTSADFVSVQFCELNVDRRTPAALCHSRALNV